MSIGLYAECAVYDVRKYCLWELWTGNKKQTWTLYKRITLTPLCTVLLMIVIVIFRCMCCFSGSSRYHLYDLILQVVYHAFVSFCLVLRENGSCTSSERVCAFVLVYMYAFVHIFVCVLVRMLYTTNVLLCITGQSQQ